MVNERKREPIEPPEPIGPLHESLEAALTDREARERLSIELRVSGGLPAQRYRYNFRASGGGELVAGIEDATRQRRSTPKAARLDDRDMQELLTAVRRSGVLNLRQDAPSFLPDTVVGKLTISDGETTQVYYFIADEAQAETQGQPPPPAVKEVVDIIYRLGGQMLDMPSLKP